MTVGLYFLPRSICYLPISDPWPLHICIIIILGKLKLEFCFLLSTPIYMNRYNKHKKVQFVVKISNVFLCHFSLYEKKCSVWDQKEYPWNCVHPSRGSFPLTWCWCCRVRVKKERKPAASTVRAAVLPGCGECAETVAAAVPGELSFSVTDRSILHTQQEANADDSSICTRSK